ncbi:unnamed protein product [Prorocentrum cordatum]|uniref:Uncharacterized protein n=1 Tax=Prorocentrum cordatum TaxID=2364126 RepID=A0ABN9UAU9_9DINO|nr:unnamed protein product [Polarella glacialis]
MWRRTHVFCGLPNFTIIARLSVAILSRSGTCEASPRAAQELPYALYLPDSTSAMASRSSARRFVAAVFAAAAMQPALAGFADAFFDEGDLSSFVQTSAVVSSGSRVAGVPKDCEADGLALHGAEGDFGDIDVVGFIQTGVQVAARPAAEPDGDPLFDAVSL